MRIKTEHAAKTESTGPTGRARTGKIAKLPRAVREELNARMAGGESTKAILAWLNGHPAARAHLDAHHQGSPITADNLSRWRQGGYAGWLENQQAKEAIAIMAAACRNISQEERDALADQLALVLTARMVVELRKFDEMPEGPLKSAAWRDLVSSLLILRRSEFYAQKARLEREKLLPKKKAGKTELCAQERQERFRRVLGLGGPHWNNFAKRWEGEGAAEMTEKEEVERLVVEELRRRKAAREAAPPPVNLEQPVGATHEHG